MRTLFQSISEFFTSEDGVTAVEYAVMLAMIIMMCIAAVGTVGETANDIWEDNASKL